MVSQRVQYALGLLLFFVVLLSLLLLRRSGQEKTCPFASGRILRFRLNVTAVNVDVTNNITGVHS